MFSLFFTMLPIYLLGNLHCAGMCGPLVMMIGHHRYRHAYFFGRLLSFSLAGAFSGEVGAVLNLLLRRYHIPAAASLIFGSFLLLIALFQLSPISFPGEQWLAKRSASFHRTLSLFVLKDLPLSSFLLGFFTIFLPCGQTVVVFSACALSGEAAIGLFNGFAFALLTSPSLLLAMQAHSLLKRIKKSQNTILAFLTLFVGLLSFCRGLAEIEIISHWVWTPNSFPSLHFAIF